MARRVIKKEDMELIGKGKWLGLYRFKGAAPFACEIAARNNRRFGAAKCLLLATTAEWSQPIGASDLTSYCHTLRDIGLDNIRVQFLGADRPITYFPETPFTENYQLEIPGGVVEADESQRLAALREAIEEGGLEKGIEGFIQSTSLLVHPCPWDAGSHVEVYSIETAIVRGEPKPPAKDGVDPVNCALIPLLEAESWLLKQRAAGICVEGYALSALWALGLALHGGWEALQ